MFLVHILEIKNGFPNLQQFCFYMGNLVLYTGYNLWVSGRRGFVPDLDANFKLRRRAFGGGLRVPTGNADLFQKASSKADSIFIAHRFFKENVL